MDTQHPDLHPLFADHIATLKARADKALYRAKNAGRNRVVLADALSTAFNLMDSEAIAAAIRAQADVEAHVLSRKGEWMRFAA